MQSNIFADAKYRSSGDIELDYVNLFDDEISKHAAYIKVVSDFRDKNLLEYTKITKETSKLIKITFKPYKKYIRFASKGLNAKKKELAKEYSKKLKKSRSEVQGKYKKMLGKV